MSNNRKRNMRKLARNIITGTALAVGGLTQTSASETTRTETQTNNSGGMNAGTIASLTVSGLVGAATIGAGAMQYKGNKELTMKGQEETARHNQLVEETEKKKQEREEGEIKAGLSHSQARVVCNNLKVLATDNGGKNEATPEDVMNLVKKGGSGAKIIQKLATYDGSAGNAFDAAAKLAVTKLMKEVLVSKEGGRSIAKKIDKMRKLFKEHAAAVEKQSILWQVATAGGHADVSAAVLQDGDTGELGAAGGSHFIAAGANTASTAVRVSGGQNKKTKYNRMLGNLLTEDGGKVFENCFQANLVQPEVNMGTGKVFKWSTAGGGHPANRSDTVKSFRGEDDAGKLACVSGRASVGKGESSIDICIGTHACQGSGAAGAWAAGDNAVTLGIPRNLEWSSSDASAIRKTLGEGLLEGFSYKDLGDDAVENADKGMFD